MKIEPFDYQRQEKQEFVFNVPVAYMDNGDKLPLIDLIPMRTNRISEEEQVIFYIKDLVNQLL